MTLRLATEEDCRRLWEWRNEAAVRAASFDTREISYEEHQRWFGRKLQDFNTRLFVVLDRKGRAVGSIRFEITAEAAVISVAVAPGERGKGLGTAAIRQGVDWILATGLVRRVVARLRIENVGSRAAFERAGFEVRRHIRVGSMEALELVCERAGSRSGILFRVDAGPGVGLGHLQRCLSLAAALRRAKAVCCFVTNEEAGVAQRIAAAGFEGEVLAAARSGSGEDLASTLAAARRWKCDAVVLDSYELGPEYMARLRSDGLFVVAIDDLAKHPFPCHLVVNGGAQANRLPYRAAVGDTQFLLGPTYALLRPEFWDAPRRTKVRPVMQILITLGGADPYNLMPALLSLVAVLPGEFGVTCVVGPYFDNRAEVARVARTCRHPVRLVEMPDSVRDLMAEADLAISAAGQTLYELAATGTPVIAVQVAPNQADSLRALAAEGIVLTGGTAPDPALLLGVESALRSLLTNEALRAQMSRAGLGIVDGHGALRTAEAIVGALAARIAPSATPERRGCGVA